MRIQLLAALLTFSAITGDALAQPAASCDGLPNHDTLRGTLQSIEKEGSDGNTGMGNPSWAVVVNRDGIVCAVVFSGEDRSAEWPGSRVIAAEKANTANALSGPNFALSTANLFYASQPGQSLFGLTSSAPPNAAAVYTGSPEKFGQNDDPMVGKPIGGIIVFGGGLALYDTGGKILGALGVSGDTSCADHIVAWKVRHALNLDAVPAGVAKNANDNMILDIRDGTSASGFGHPSCKGGKGSDDVLNSLPDKYPTGPGQ
jgi:uncharacterized protein GlcG (DUF336 family)